MILMVLGFVLKAIGYILLFLLALGVLLMVVPVTLKIDFRENQLTLKVRVLFVYLTVFPWKFGKGKQTDKPKKAKPQKAKKPKKPKPEKPKKEKAPMTAEDILNLVKRIASSVSEAMKFVLRGFWIRNVEILIPIKGEDAAAVAENWGKLQVVLVNTQAVLGNFLNIRYKSVVMIPDFAEKYQDRFVFACKIIVSPVIMLVAGIAGGVHFLRYKKRGYTLQEYVEAQRAKNAPKPPKNSPQG